MSKKRIQNKTPKRFLSFLMKMPILGYINGDWPKAGLFFTNSRKSIRYHHAEVKTGIYFFDERISFCHLSNRCQSVLDNTHDRSVALRCNDHFIDHSQLQNLSSSFHGLRNMKIHLITIEISVVRCGYREI